MPAITPNYPAAVTTRPGSEPRRVLKARLEMVDAATRICQIIGLPKSVGQIYGLLYLSIPPVSFDELCQTLQISMGIASISTRKLISWGAIRKVRFPGDLRTYYEVAADLKRLIRSSFRDLVKPRVSSSARQIGSLLDTLESDRQQGRLTASDHRFCLRRIKKLSKLQKRIDRLVPIAEKLM